MINRDCGTRIRAWGDGWGFLWIESLGSGPTGLQEGNDSFTVTSSNIATATGFPLTSTQTYAATEIGINSTHVISEHPLANNPSAALTINRTLRIKQGQLRNMATSAFLPWKGGTWHQISSSLTSY